MIIAFLLACKPHPVVLDQTLIDSVQGAPRPDVTLTLSSTGPKRCSVQVTSGADGSFSAKLCAEEQYTVQPLDPTLILRPAVAGSGAELVASGEHWGVLDQPTGLALIGGGITPLDVMVDVRPIEPKGHEGTVPTPAILPIELPTWTPTTGRKLFVPEAMRGATPVPLVRTAEVRLRDGSPLQPWYTLGYRQNEGGGFEPVDPATPFHTEEVPGGVIWSGLPPGTWAWMSPDDTRVPLLRVVAPD